MVFARCIRKKKDSANPSQSQAVTQTPRATSGLKLTPENENASPTIDRGAQGSGDVKSRPAWMRPGRTKSLQRDLLPFGRAQKGAGERCCILLWYRIEITKSLAIARLPRVVPVVGLEPTRVAPTDFESVTSAIPSHRRKVLRPFQYIGIARQSQEKV